MPRKALIFLTCAGIDFQIPIHENANNAECATESPAEPAGFILRMFQLPEQRPREAASMFRLVRVESERTRGDRSMFRLQDCAFPESSEALPYKNPKIPHRTPPPRTIHDCPHSTGHYPLPTNNYTPGFMPCLRLNIHHQIYFQKEIVSWDLSQQHWDP